MWRGPLFGRRCVRRKPPVPVGGGMRFQANGQWDFAKAEPVDWFKGELKLSF